MSDWPAELHIVGKSTTRVDGAAKVTGAAKYTSDVQPPGCLVGMILRSIWGAARVTSIDLEPARKVPGVKAVIANMAAGQMLRFYGQEIAAVAAESRHAAEAAIAAIKVVVEELPFVVREEDAMKAGSPPVWEGGPNYAPSQPKVDGDPDAAFASAAAVVEAVLSTPVQVHNPLETHGVCASVANGKATVWASTQGIFSVRDGIAGSTGIPQNDVQVISDYMGGGFGAKFGAGAEGTLATKLSQAAGVPVKLMLSRFEQNLAVGNRPSSHQKIRLAADAAGKLTAFELIGHGTAGIGGGAATAGGGGGAGIPAPYIYKVPNKRVQQDSVVLNAGSARAFRAPGCPPASFGMESVLDDLAVKLGIDPVAIRITNDPSDIRRRQYQEGAERFGWKSLYRKPGTSPGVVKSGIGCAGASWGGGGGGTKAMCQINPDGTVEVRCGTQDLGTGTRTLMAVVAAEVFGIPVDRISAKLGDTNFPPSGGSGGSTTAPSVAPAIFDTCGKALEQLKQQTGVTDVSGAGWNTACRKLGVQPLVANGAWRKGLSDKGTGGVQFARVEVDTETGFVSVKKILCIQDCGLMVNRLTAESQVNGGIIMGLGYALYEQRVMDRVSGVVLNPNFETYKVPGGSDVPEIEIIMESMPERGVIGIGEPVTIPTASAIANAVANALGVRVTSLPLTPDKVLAALGKVPA